jgi:GNAT superfamily N-acetyltransferase
MGLISIERIHDPPQHVLAGLVEESSAQGSDHLRRLVEECRLGTRRFEGPGEGLFVALRDGRVVAVCGLDIDPDAADGKSGRLRNMYVSATHRRSGIGREFARDVIERARQTFTTLTLRADTAGAAKFFETLGFRPTTAPNATHFLKLDAP